MTRHRVGFRTVEVTGGRLLVNGRAVTIRGVNRHEHTAEGGKAVSWESMLLDATMLKAADCAGCLPEGGE